MPANILALGPELRALARELTNDLNEACYLAHQVVSRVLSEPDADQRHLDIETARTLLHEAARNRRPPGPLPV